MGTFCQYIKCHLFNFYLLGVIVLNIPKMLIKSQKNSIINADKLKSKIRETIINIAPIAHFLFVSIVEANKQ